MKVFLGVKDNNYNFVNRFLESFDYSYDLTIGLLYNNADLPIHDDIININFIKKNHGGWNIAVKIFESIINDYDLVVSNNISSLSTAAIDKDVRCIQYSDLFLYTKTRQITSLFGSASTTHLKTNLLDIREIPNYNRLESYIMNPLYFFERFYHTNIHEKKILKPYYKIGTPDNINESLVISNIADKKIISETSLNISLLDDFKYNQINMNSAQYYNLISSSEEIITDADYLLIGDCLFNNQRPLLTLNSNSVESYMLYNVARVLNLSKCADFIPFAKHTDDNQYNTLDVEIKQILKI